MMRTSAAAIAAGLACVLGGDGTPLQARVPSSTQPGAVTPGRAPDPPVVADASEIPALENDAAPPELGSALPGCLRCDAPLWPTPITERWRFRLHLVLQASGRVGTARIVQVLVGDSAARPVGPMGDVTPAMREAPTARAGLAVLAAVRQWQFEPPARAPMLLLVDVGVPTDLPTTAGAGPAGAMRSPVPVGGDIAPPRKLVDVPPRYPADALAARITGIVTIEAVIGTTGDVVQARVVAGVPMLDDAALAAVRQWKYTPTVVNGEAVPVIMTVTLNFRLNPPR